MTNPRSIIGRCRRSFRARGKVFRIAAWSVAVVLLLELASLAAWWAFSTWRLGRVVLTTEGPPLEVQVLTESGDAPIGEPVALVPSATLALPHGDYRLRVRGMGQLGRTYRMAVNGGETLEHMINLDEGRLLGEGPVPRGGRRSAEKRRPIPYASTVTAVELAPGKSDLVEWTGRSILRRDGVSGQVVWDALQVPDIRGPRGDVAAGLIWLARRIQREALVLPAPDLNGDGTRDLVWPFREEAAFLAVSGKDWKVLWTYRAELDGPGGPYAEGPSGPVPIRPSRIIGIPSQADLDADGIPDLIATLVFSESPLEVARRLPGKKPDVHYEPDLSRRIVLAISGRSSTRLWSHAIDPAFATMPTPLEQRPAAFVPGRKESTVAIVNGATWLGLDPATGRPRSGPIPLGFEPERPLQYADLDGDGEPEILALGPGPSPTQRTLSAFSIATGRPPWSATVNAIHEHPYDKSIRETWPLVVNLDGDGRSEVVVPDTGALDRTHRYVGVRLLDGPTGLPRWTRPMHPESKVIDGIVDVVEAPDLDRDGTRDIATTSRYAGRKPLAGSTGSIEAQQAYVNAISGKDGRPLWWWRIELPSERSTHLASPLWWGRGPDGWPLLAIPIGGQDPHRIPDLSPPSVLDFPTVHVLEASTGRVVHTLPGLGQVHGDDLDGDGLLDLWGEHEGDLRAFRGEGPEAWRALEMLDPARASYLETRGEFHPPADLDGDGIGDALTTMVIAPGPSPNQATGSRTAIARSGRDGRLLWKAELDARRSWFDPDRHEDYGLQTFPLPAGDLDGDGTPDVFVL